MGAVESGLCCVLPNGFDWERGGNCMVVFRGGKAKHEKGILLLDFLTTP